jgi:23S rRNA (pseudouridine1915-N3)-methyltransferase
VKLAVAKIGRVAYPEITSLAAMYRERTQAFAKVDALDFKDDEAFLKHLRAQPGGVAVVQLEERGKTWASPELAKRLQRWADDPATKQVLFVVGGPMGLSAELKARADEKWSLSPATFTSDLAWLLCWEQIYRAYNILKGTGYHHD